MDRKQQITTMHAAFINEVVRCIQNPERAAEFGQLMRLATENGWGKLVSVIQTINRGRRDVELLNQLDEEDQAIAESILRGLRDPSTLPDPNVRPDPAHAAPGLASMIHAAACGNVQALQIIGNMADQMSKAGGPMARLASVIRPIINGERDPHKLCKKLDSRSEAMVLSILDELKQLENR